MGQGDRDAGKVRTGKVVAGRQGSRQANDREQIYNASADTDNNKTVGIDAVIGRMCHCFCNTTDRLTTTWIAYTANKY